jgi:uncharacterized coiled-coil protein SlyX
VITQKEINDKSIIGKACEEEEISMAVSTLARQGLDKVARQAYQRRKDEIHFYIKEKQDSENKLKEAEATIAEKDNALAEKEATLAEQAKIIAEPRSQLEKKPEK